MTRIEGLKECLVEMRLIRPNGTVLISTRLPLAEGVAVYPWSPDSSQGFFVSVSAFDMCSCKTDPDECRVHGHLLRDPRAPSEQPPEPPHGE